VFSVQGNLFHPVSEALRFYLTATFPETRDTEPALPVPSQVEGRAPKGHPGRTFERNNHVLSAHEGNELVAKWDNLGQRPMVLGFMLSFAYERFDGKVPEPGDLDAEDRELLAKVEAGFETVSELYSACNFRAALGEVPSLAHEGAVASQLPS
jgi:hypothetical protein